MRRAGRFGAQAALLSLLAAPRARADEGASVVEGAVRSAEGVAIASADVVATGAGRSWRAATRAGADGRFRLVVPEAGPAVLVVYDPRGTVVAAQVVELRWGERHDLDVAGPIAAERRDPAPPEAALGVAPVVPRTIAGGPLVRERDLAGLVERAPGATSITPATAGGGLLGVGPGELRVTFDGLALTDPLDGRAPLELSTALFPVVAVSSDLASAVDGGTGGGAVTLGTAVAAGPRVRGAAGAGWSSAPRGSEAAGAGAGHAEVAAAGSRGGLGGRVAVAPRFGERRADPGLAFSRASRRARTLPALASGAAAAGGWDLRAAALAWELREQVSHGARITPLHAPDERTRRTFALVASARRGFDDGKAVSLSAGTLRTTRDEVSLADERLREEGARLFARVEGELEGTLAGRHVLRSSLGIERASGERRGPFEARAALAALRRAEASALAPWIALEDRFRPVAFLELELGLRASRRYLRSENDLRAEALTFATDLLLEPRAALRAWHPATGVEAFVRVGRYETPLPLAPALAAAGAPEGIRAPHDDVAAVGASWRRAGAALDVGLLERRSREIVEDRFAPVTGRLAPFNPAASRRYRALLLRGALRLGPASAELAYVNARARGTYAGFADLATGRLRPGATGAFDVPDPTAARRGPLPLDVRHGLRLAAEARGRARGFELAGGLAGRLDSGLPLSALARGAASGPGAVLVLPRGSVGRLPWTGALDASVGVARWMGDARLSIALEGFNLTNAQPVVARDQIFSDRPTAPRVPGAAAAPMPRPGYLAETAYAEPRLLRVTLALEL